MSLTVRVAQTVIRMALEPVVDKVFHPDSYGYRPCRSPHDALRVCRERCWASDWVVDLDVKAFFDTVPWDLMLRAVGVHFFKGCVIAGRFGHAASPRAGMLSGS